MLKTVTILNKKARFDYEILETYTAGIVLAGTEIKSIRGGKAGSPGLEGVRSWFPGNPPRGDPGPSGHVGDGRRVLDLGPIGPVDEGDFLAGDRVAEGIGGLDGRWTRDGSAHHHELTRLRHRDQEREGADSGGCLGRRGGRAGNRGGQGLAAKLPP